MTKIIKKVKDNQTFGFLAISALALIIATIYVGIAEISQNDGVNILLVLGGAFASSFIGIVFSELSGKEYKVERIKTAIALKWVAVMLVIVFTFAFSFENIEYVINMASSFFGLLGLIICILSVWIKGKRKEE